MSAAARTTYEYARAYVDAGIPVIPIKPDGSKTPAIEQWNIYRQRMPTDKELHSWFDSGRNGIAILAGDLAGNRQVLDCDSLAKYDQLRFLAEAHGLLDLLDSLVRIQTPRPGIQLTYRCAEPIGGNKKLAQELLDIPEGAEFVMRGSKKAPQEYVVIEGAEYKVVTDDSGQKWAIHTGIETRGEGGYTLAPGSPLSCHPTGRPYDVVRGDLLDLPVLTAEENDTLLGLCRMLNDTVEGVQTVGASTFRKSASERSDQHDGQMPGDDYNERGPFEELLVAHGWQPVLRRGDMIGWRRPGKTDRGISATTGYRGWRGLYVFSSNAAPFEAERGYKPFAVYALLEHGGDFGAAASRLYHEEYGDRRTATATACIAAATSNAPGDEPRVYETVAEYKKAGWALERKRMMDTAENNLRIALWYLAIVKEPFPGGKSKSDWVKEVFGEDRCGSIRNLASVVTKWRGTEMRFGADNSLACWEFYRTTAKASPEDKERYLRDYEKRIPMSKIKESVAETYGEYFSPRKALAQVTSHLADPTKKQIHELVMDGYAEGLAKAVEDTIRRFYDTATTVRAHRVAATLQQPTTEPVTAIDACEANYNDIAVTAAEPEYEAESEDQPVLAIDAGIAENLSPRGDKNPARSSVKQPHDGRIDAAPDVDIERAVVMVPGYEESGDPPDKPPIRERLAVVLHGGRWVRRVAIESALTHEGYGGWDVKQELERLVERDMILSRGGWDDREYRIPGVL